MPWEIVKGGGKCESGQWAVVKKGSGETEGCHDSRDAAMQQLRALYASEEDMAELPNGWRGPIAALDIPTGDVRMLMTPPGGLRTRRYPMSFTRQHIGSETDIWIGTIDRAWVQRSAEGEFDELWGEGSFDLGGEDGREAARMLMKGLETVSIHPDQVTFEQWFIKGSYGVDYERVEPEVAVDISGDFPQLREGFSAKDVMTDWRLASVALVSIPAFDEARIEPVFDYKPTVEQPQFSGSAMVALRPDNPERLALATGSAAEDLHVTLAYLGDVAELECESKDAEFIAANVALGWTEQKRPMAAKVAGYGVLGDKGAVVVFLNGGDLALAHGQAKAALSDTDKVFAEQHAPFLAHLTLGYPADGDHQADMLSEAAKMVGQELTFSKVSFDWGPERVDWALFEEDKEDEEEEDCEPIIAAITGNLSLPVARDRKMKWDGHKARQTVAKWASSDGSGDLEKINWTKFGQAFLYRGKPKSGNSTYAEGESGYRVEDFKGGFATVIDGQLTIVPNGAIGLAGGHGITAMNVPEAEKKALKRKLCSLYARVRSVHKDFPDCPFEGKDADTSLLAAVGGQTFEAADFADPQLTGPTPLTVTEDGRVFGHVALWNSCYQASPALGSCTKPPRSRTEYARFHVHGARLSDGSTLPVGVITFGEGHRDHGGLRAAQAAYANIATAAAKVRAGEDEFGVWVSGRVLDAFADRAYDLLLSPLSGHWEPDADAGGLEMLAAHVVVAPGFKVSRIVASLGEGGEIEAIQFTGPFREGDEAERQLNLQRRFGCDPDTRARAALARMGL